jgi:hypothetical protein
MAQDLLIDRFNKYSGELSEVNRMLIKLQVKSEMLGMFVSDLQDLIKQREAEQSGKVPIIGG